MMAVACLDQFSKNVAVTFPFGTHQMKVLSKGDPKQKDIIMGGIPTPEF